MTDRTGDQPPVPGIPVSEIVRLVYAYVSITDEKKRQEILARAVQAGGRLQD